MVIRPMGMNANPCAGNFSLFWSCLLKKSFIISVVDHDFGDFIAQFNYCHSNYPYKLGNKVVNFTTHL